MDKSEATGDAMHDSASSKETIRGRESSMPCVVPMMTNQWDAGFPTQIADPFLHRSNFYPPPVNQHPFWPPFFHRPPFHHQQFPHPLIAPIGAVEIMPPFPPYQYWPPPIPSSPEKRYSTRETQTTPSLAAPSQVDESKSQASRLVSAKVSSELVPSPASSIEVKTSRMISPPTAEEETRESSDSDEAADSSGSTEESSSSEVESQSIESIATASEELPQMFRQLHVPPADFQKFMVKTGVAEEIEHQPSENDTHRSESVLVENQ